MLIYLYTASVKSGCYATFQVNYFHVIYLLWDLSKILYISQIMDQALQGDIYFDCVDPQKSIPNLCAVGQNGVPKYKRLTKTVDIKNYKLYMTSSKKLLILR
jgi:hypothetical protein